MFGRIKRSKAMRTIIFIFLMIIGLIVMLRLENRLKKHYKLLYSIGCFLVFWFLFVSTFKNLSVIISPSASLDAGVLSMGVYGVVLIIMPIIYSIYLSIKSVLFYRSARKAFLLIVLLHSFVALMAVSMAPVNTFKDVGLYYLLSFLLPVITIMGTKLVLRVQKTSQKIDDSIPYSPTGDVSATDAVENAERSDI